jgi:hypothetical protein
MERAERAEAERDALRGQLAASLARFANEQWRADSDRHFAEGEYQLARGTQQELQVLLAEALAERDAARAGNAAALAQQKSIMQGHINAAEAERDALRAQLSVWQRCPQRDLKEIVYFARSCTSIMHELTIGCGFAEQWLATLPQPEVQP